MKLTKQWRQYNEDQLLKGKPIEPRFPYWLEFIYKGVTSEIEQTNDTVEESRETTL